MGRTGWFLPGPAAQARRNAARGLGQKPPRTGPVPWHGGKAGGPDQPTCHGGEGRKKRPMGPVTARFLTRGFKIAYDFRLLVE
jgi:hypothetical protein